MNPQFVTITGVDDRTDPEALARLSERFPVEWAILLSPTARGVSHRFPSQETIDRIADVRMHAEMRLAAHLCGGHAKDVMKGVFDRNAIDLSLYGRIQVNHVKPDSKAIRDFSVPGQTVIAQWRDPKSFPTEEVGHQWLYDPSGGKGFSPESWPRNPAFDIRGYAGGIGPHNVVDVAAAVSPLSPSGFWLDMESAVRTDDWLDLRLVEIVLDSLYG